MNELDMNERWARCIYCGDWVTRENGVYRFTPDTAFTSERHEWHHKDQCPETPEQQSPPVGGRAAVEESR